MHRFPLRLTFNPVRQGIYYTFIDRVTWQTRPNPLSRTHSHVRFVLNKCFAGIWTVADNPHTIKPTSTPPDCICIQLYRYTTHCIYTRYVFIQLYRCFQINLPLCYLPCVLEWLPLDFFLRTFFFACRFAALCTRTQNEKLSA
jgi:hypothetical protein